MCSLIDFDFEKMDETLACEHLYKLSLEETKDGSTAEAERINLPMFYGLCDLIGVDYKQLSLELTDCFFNSGFYTEAMLNSILKSHHPLLAQASTVTTILKYFNLVPQLSKEKIGRNRIFKYVYSHFIPFNLLKIYCEEIYNNNTLKDEDIFRIYAEVILGAKINIYRHKENETYEVEDDFFNTAEFSDKMIIDWFLHKLNTSEHKVYAFFQDTISYCATSFYIMIKYDYSIKMCEHCGNYFVPYNRADTLYCNRPAPEDGTKTCKEYGATSSYKNKLITDEAAGLCRKKYMQKQMRTVRNPQNEKYQDDFIRFKTGVKEWKAKIKADEREKEDYLNWLKGQD